MRGRFENVDKDLKEAQVEMGDDTSGSVNLTGILLMLLNRQARGFSEQEIVISIFQNDKHLQK